MSLSLQKVAEMTLAGEPFDYCLANFLDEFYSAPMAESLQECPALLAPGLGRFGEVADAYVAATAEELARKFGFPMPEWVRTKERRLSRPWFASDLAGLRAVLLLESPVGFRSRNLFVSENALSRV
jgi:hypothetical protein